MRSVPPGASARGIQVLALVAGVGCLLLALFWPGDRLTDWLASPLVARQRVAEGVGLLRFCLPLDGLLLLAVAMATVWSPDARAAGRPKALGTLDIGLCDTARRQERRWRPWPQAAVLAILAVATVARFAGAGGDLWLDETGSLPAVRLPLHQLIATYPSPNQHILYALLAHLSARLFGESALTLRLPAVLFGIAGVWALYRLARSLTGAVEALLASLFLAVSYHHIFFSQNARGYTAMVCLSLLASAVFLEAVARNRAGLWLLYGLLTVLNVSTHLFAVFVVAGHLTAYAVGRGAWAVGRGNEERRARGEGGISRPSPFALRLTAHAPRPTTRNLLLTVGVAGLICAHLYLLVLPQAAGYYLGAERAGIGYGYSTPGGFLGEVVRGLRIGFVGTAGLAVAGLVCLAGLASYLRQSLFSVVALFAWMVYPALAVLLRLGLYPRFFLFALPLGILLAVRGLHVLADWLLGRLGRVGRIPGLARQYGWVALGLAGVLVSMVPLGALYRVPKQDFSGALAYAEQVKQPDDQIVAVNLAGPVYRNFYRPDLPVAEDVDDLQALRRQGHTLWLIYIFPEDMEARFPELYRLITSQGQPVRRFPGLIGNGEVYVSRMAPLAR